MFMNMANLYLLSCALLTAIKKISHKYMHNSYDHCIHEKESYV